MKKCILSALAGAGTMFLLLLLIVKTHNAKGTKKYEHIDFVSITTESECYVCGDSGDYTVSTYWGEDNVGIVDLNTFELLYLPINRYGDHGELIEEPSGVLLSDGLMDREADTYAHAYTFPDNAYSFVQITGVQYAIDPNSVQSRLCQTCLDSINSLWFTTQPPAEYAIVNFAEHTIQPLLNSQPWFGIGNFGIDCEFKNNGAIDLLIHYCPNRYE